LQNINRGFVTLPKKAEHRTPQPSRAKAQKSRFRVYIVELDNLLLCKVIGLQFYGFCSYYFFMLPCSIH